MLVLDPFYRGLSFRFAEFFSGKILRVSTKFFGDGEFYVRFNRDSVDGDVFVLLGMYPEPSFSIVRGVFYIETLKDLGASRIFLITPYFAYGRQDKRFLSGECISAKVVANTFFKAGADYIITIDVHNPDAFREFGDKFVNLSAVPAVANYIMDNFDIGNAFLISPDKGRIHTIKELSSATGIPYTWFVKERDLKSGGIVKHEPHNLSELKELVSERSIAIIYDDIISTGSTIANIAKYLRENIGFKGKIVTIFTHGLFLSSSIEKLVSSGVSEIVSTDTVDNPFSKISVVPIIHDFLKSFDK